MKFGRRQLVLASLVLALGAAVYLNWQFSDIGATSLPTTTQVGKELGEAEFVSGNPEETKPDNEDATQTPSENEEATQTNAQPQNSDEYFAQSELERQEVQDKLTQSAKDILEAVSSDENLKEEALAQAMEIANIIQQQVNIESLIKAKGFSQCLAFIQNGECSIVVSKDEMTDDKIIAIKDIVSGQANIDFDKIKIIQA